MGAVALVVVLAGMLVPITILLATLAFDVGVLLWALYRLWNARGRPWLRRLEGRARVAGALRAHPRSVTPFH